MAGLIISSSGDHTAADHAYETAIYVAKDAVRLAPDNPEPHKWLALIYRRLGMFTTASDEYCL